MKNVKMLLSALTLMALLILPVVASPILGEEEPKFFLKPPQEGVNSLWEVAKKTLSGPVSLVVEGKDPRFHRTKEAESQEASRGERTQAAAAALVPYRSATARFSRNVLITRDFSRTPFQTEPHIAVNPKNAEHLIVGVIDYSFPSIASYVSIDGGATWEGPFQSKYLDADLGVGGDPIVGFDRDGNAYYAYISIGDEEFSISGVAYSDLVSSISVAKSADGGRTWSRPISSSRSTIVVRESAGTRDGPSGEIAIGFLDKPWMTVGPDRTDISRDALYVTYTEFVTRFQIVRIFQGSFFYFANPVLETTIKVVKSSDGGVTWSKPVAVSPTVKRFYGGSQAQGSNPSFSTRVVQGSQPKVAPDGTVYVTWLDSTDDDSFKGSAEIMTAKSEDGGRTFARPVRAAFIDKEPDFSSRTSFFRSWSSAFPQIATGPNGEVYITYVARSPSDPVDDGDVFLVSSTDKGLTWTRPRRLNDDTGSRFQFFPAVAVNEKGVVHVMWGDMRDDPQETSYNIYYTRSNDSGKTWLENSRVTDFPSNPNYGFPGGAFIGDYYAITASKDEVYLVWSDSRLGEFGSFNQKIAFARLSPMPSPSIFLSPPRGPAGKDVVIQGFNFQADQEIFIQVAGEIVSTARTNDKGRFTASVFTPISGQGAHNILVIDASGNVASGSFFTEYGFDTLRDSFKKTTDDILNKIAPIEAGLKRLNITGVLPGIPGQPQVPQPGLGVTAEELSRTIRSAVGDQMTQTKADQQELKNRLQAVSADVAGIAALTQTLTALVAVAVLVSIAGLLMIMRRTKSTT